MDRSIPRAAALILDFIRHTETGRVGDESYEVIFGHNQHKLKKPITQMTLGEIQAAQARWSRRFGSSAAAGYQFMKATLRDLMKELKLSPSLVLTPDLQDRLAFHLLKRRGYLDFVNGRISRTEFGKRLAMEWASFPVLAKTKGRHRGVNRGESFYAGDKLNKALARPADVERLLSRALSLVDGETLPPAAPKPPEKPADAQTPPATADDTRPPEKTRPRTPQGGLRGIGAAIGAAVLAFFAWLASLPCSLFDVWCG